MNTATLNKAQIAYIKTETTAALEKINQNTSENENCTIKDILNDLYQKGLPDKTEAQADLMSDAILDAVYSFDNEFKNALDDFDGWLDDFLANQLNGKTLEEQYDIAFRLMTIITLIQEQAAHCKLLNNDYEIDDFLNKMEINRVTKENLSEKDVQEVISKIKESSQNSAVIFGTCFTEIEEFLENEIDETSIVNKIKNAQEELNYNAIASMIAYVGCKDGRIQGVPTDISAKQITYEICAGMKAAEIIYQAETGVVTWDFAKKVLTVIANIVLLIASVKLTIGVGVAFGVLTGSIFGFLIGAGFMSWLCFKLVKPYNEIVNVSLELGKELVLATIPILKNGLDFVSNWISETAIPKTVDFIKSIIAFFSNKISQGMTVVNEFKEHQHVGMEKSID